MRRRVPSCIPILLIAAWAVGLWPGCARAEQRPKPAATEPTDAATAAKAVREATGSRTRICWERNGKLVFFDSAEPNYVVRGYDADVRRPVITPDGKQVVFIDFGRWSSYVVDWGGRKARKLVAGRVTHVRPEWKDGKLIAQWAYWQTRDNRILTAPLSDVSKPELVWRFKGWKPRRGKSTNFQTSADGKRAGATFPWPSNGVAPLDRDNAEFTRFGTGCWPQMAKDNSYRFFHCSGGRHEWLAMYDGQGSKGWWVRVNPRTGSAECPRWANDPRFIVATDRPREGDTWVYLGQFDKDFKRLVRWVAVCSEGKNTQADVWTQSAAGKAPAPHKGNPLAGIRPPVAAEKSWPGSHEQLLYVWRNAAADNRVRDANGTTVRRCVASMHGLARPTHNHAADVTGGTLRLETLGELLAKTARRNGEFTLEMVAIPRDGWCGRERVVFAMADREQQNLVISQHRDRLLLRLRTSKTDANAAPLTIGKVHRNRKAEVAVTFADGMVRVFFSGKPAGSKRLGGDLSDWKAAPVVCGSRGGKSWAGSAAAIAVSSHARDVGEIKQRWELLQGRKWWRTQEPARLVVGAKLVAKSARPAVDQLGEYNRALAVDAYEVEKVLRGRLGAKRILVSRWVVLDRKKLDDAQAVGKSYKLTVEKLSAHPYLKMESSSNTLDEFDTPEFYNVALPAAAN